MNKHLYDRMHDAVMSAASESQTLAEHDNDNVGKQLNSISDIISDLECALEAANQLELDLLK